MRGLEDHKSGKGAGDENFPVASWVIEPRLRAPVLAYYRFARSADDAADHPTLAPSEKLRRLDSLEASLLGKSDEAHDALPLRRALAEHGLSPRHAQDLLVAFRQDVTKTRYASWNELMDYCRFSAAPVGRFVLDVHGESPAAYPHSDALCAALQVINHIQDCGKDYSGIDRVYVPLDMLAAANASVDMLRRDHATPALLGVLRNMMTKTGDLLANGQQLPTFVANRRLAMEIAAIAGLATRLTALLKVRDPLVDRVHLSKPLAAGIALRSALRQFFRHKAPAVVPAATMMRGQR